MALQPADEITGLLRAWSEGDESALDLLMPLVYGELHRAALPAHGPRSARLGLIVLNTMLALGVHPRVAEARWTLGVVVAAMALVFAWRLAANLSRLARLEPQRFRWWDAKGS